MYAEADNNTYIFLSKYVHINHKKYYNFKFMLSTTYFYIYSIFAGLNRVNSDIMFRINHVVYLVVLIPPTPFPNAHSRVELAIWFSY